MPLIYKITLLFALAFGLKGFSFESSIAQTPLNYRIVGAPLHPLKLIDRAGIEYTELDISEDHPFILILFNPTCGHCVDVASMIMDHKEELEDCTIMMMAGPEMEPYLKDFVAESKWEDGSNRFLGVDGSGLTLETYNYNNVPQVNIYDSSKKCIKIFNGDISFDQLKAYIQ